MSIYNYRDSRVSIDPNGPRNRFQETQLLYSILTATMATIEEATATYEELANIERAFDDAEIEISMY